MAPMLALLAALGVPGCGTTADDTCALATEHVAQCSGFSVEPPASCDPAEAKRAEQLLAMGCEELQTRTASWNWLKDGIGAIWDDLFGHEEPRCWGIKYLMGNAYEGYWICEPYTSGCNVTGRQIRYLKTPLPSGSMTACLWQYFPPGGEDGPPLFSNVKGQCPECEGAQFPMSF
jgi:hypothetical protein